MSVEVGGGGSFSKPSSSHAMLSSGLTAAPHANTTTVATNSGWTADRLGYFSPAYTRGAKGSSTISGHGIMGSIGYTSSSHTTLQPSSQSQAKDSSLRLLHGGRAKGAAGAGATSDAITTNKRANAGRLTQRDLDKLEENQRQQKEIYESWKKQKDAELKSKKERDQRLQKQDMQRYVQREMRVREEQNDAFKEWNIRKGLKSEVQAMERAVVMKLTRHIGCNRNITASPSSKLREGGFELRTAPVTLPTRKGFDATLPYLFAPQQQKQDSSRGSLSKLLAQARLRKSQEAEALNYNDEYQDNNNEGQYYEGQYGNNEGQYNEGQYYEGQYDAPRQGTMLPPIVDSSRPSSNVSRTGSQAAEYPSGSQPGSRTGSGGHASALDFDFDEGDGDLGEDDGELDGDLGEDFDFDEGDDGEGSEDFGSEDGGDVEGAEDFDLEEEVVVDEPVSRPGSGLPMIEEIAEDRLT